MLEGKVHAATCFITERDESGVLCHQMKMSKGKTVMEVLLSNHPDQGNPNEEAFMHCNDLPEFLDNDVTASHVENVAHKLSGFKVWKSQC